MKWTFSALFGIGESHDQLPVAATSQPTSLPVAAGSGQNDRPEPAATGSYRQLPAATGSESFFPNARPIGRLNIPCRQRKYGA
jgi:hypothetical protein